MKQAKMHWIFWLATCVGLLSKQVQVAGQQPVFLSPGQPVERQLKGGETHLYQLSLVADAYLNLTVSYAGVHTDVTFKDANGQTLSTYRSDTTTLGSHEVAFIAATAGSYQLAVQGRASQEVGKYTITIKEWRAATEADRQYVTAQRMTDEAYRLIALRTAEGRRQGIAKMQEALLLWRASKNLEGELSAMKTIADTQFVLGDFRPALEIAREILTKARAAGLRYWEMKGLQYVGLLNNSVADYPTARQTLEQALALSRELQQRLEERGILNGLGIATTALGQPYAAIEYYQQALKLAREIGDRAGEATSLRNLALRYENIGEPDQALANYQQALMLRRELGNRDTEAHLLLDMARVQMRSGEIQKALELAYQARTQLRTAGRKEDEAAALTLQGQAHTLTREFDLAFDEFTQALELYRATGNNRYVAATLMHLGALQRNRGKAAEAGTVLEEMLTLQRRLGRPKGLSTGLLELAINALAQSQPQQALTYLTEAQTLSRQSKELIVEAQVLWQTSRALRALNQSVEAKVALQRALTLSRTAKYDLLQADILHDLAALALQQGQYVEAQTQIEAALAIIENSRTGLVNPATRAEFRSSRQSYYALYVEALLRRHEREGDDKLVAQALAAVESARARSLLDLLGEARADIRQGVKADLLAEENTLRQRLLAKSDLLTQVGLQQNGQEQARLLEADIVKLTTALGEVETRIRAASPAYAALTQPQPLTPAELQSQVLDRQTLLLEFALGRERSHLFAVTPTSIKVFTLPGQEEIAAAVGHFYEAVKAPGTPRMFSNVAEKQAWLKECGRAAARTGSALSQMLLAPAAAEMKGKRLLIVPDGALHYLPFAALPEPEAQKAKSKTAQHNRPEAAASPLIVQHELLTLPSASTLSLLRLESAQRTKPNKALALFADPVFGQDDERLSTPANGKALADVAAQRSGIRLARLPASRQEAESIRQFVPTEESMIVMGFQANRAAVTESDLQQYRYIHFATHGLFNSQHPALSALVLSQVDAQGNAQNGFLRTIDIFNLRLNAELVVLSGCQTALGKELNGEGLIGLTRGFFYAGAHRVLASLWQVNDAATARLMQHFYRNMLREKQLAPAAALRAAQLAMLQEPQWRLPYYWAAFTLQGEW